MPPPPKPEPTPPPVRVITTTDPYGRIVFVAEPQTLRWRDLPLGD